jgi:hypothetical protein
MAPIVRITHDRTVVDASAEGLGRASETFARQHALALPEFLTPDLLQFCQTDIERAGFVTRVHTDLPSRPSDLVANPGSALGILLLLLNDPVFLAVARRVTGREDIQSFGGTVHRRLPAAGHDDAWHNDVGGGRIEVHPALKHRVTPPEGSASRTVFAGWFLPYPLREVVRY